MVIKRMILAFFASLSLAICVAEQQPTNKQSKEETFLTLEDAEQALEEFYKNPKISEQHNKKVCFLSKNALSNIIRCVNYQEECTTNLYFMPDDANPAFIKEDNLSDDELFKFAQSQLTNEIREILENRISEMYKDDEKDFIDKKIARETVELFIKESTEKYFFLTMYFLGKRSMLNNNK